MLDHRLEMLRIFAGCGTIARTAELTGYSPSAVSQQLRDLQRALGITILERDGRILRLTAAGEELVRGSHDLAAQWEQVRSAALTADARGGRRLGIGGFSTAAASLIAPLAATLRARHPQLSVRVVEANPARCIDLLQAGRLDLALVIAMQGAPGPEDPRFDQIVLLDDPLDVLLPADHPAAAEPAVRLEDLAGEEWITDGAETPYYALFTSAFTAAGVSPRVMHEVVEWETQMALVSAGIGVGLVPRLVPINPMHRVVRAPVAGAAPVRRILAVTRRGTGEAVLIAEAISCVREVARELERVRSNGPPVRRLEEAP